MLPSQDDLARTVANDLILHHVTLTDETEYSVDTPLPDFGLDSLAYVEFALRILDTCGLSDDCGVEDLQLEETSTPARVAETLIKLMRAKNPEENNMNTNAVCKAADVVKTSDQMTEMGKAAYAGYCKSTGGKRHDGSDCLSWEALPPHIQAAWGAAGCAGADCCSGMAMAVSSCQDNAQTSHCGNSVETGSGENC